MRIQTHGTACDGGFVHDRDDGERFLFGQRACRQNYRENDFQDFAALATS